jgi:hypothetical protein
MAPSRFLVATLAVGLFAVADVACGSQALAEVSQAQAKPDIREFMHQMSEGQRLMLFDQMQKETEGMSEDQSRAHRREQHQKLQAMSDSERQQFAAELQTKWDALSPADQDAIRQKAEAARAARRNERQSQGKPE